MNKNHVATQCYLDINSQNMIGILLGSAKTEFPTARAKDRQSKTVQCNLYFPKMCSDKCIQNNLQISKKTSSVQCTVKPSRKSVAIQTNDVKKRKMATQCHFNIEIQEKLCSISQKTETTEYVLQRKKWSIGDNVRSSSTKDCGIQCKIRPTRIDNFVQCSGLLPRVNSYSQCNFKLLKDIRTTVTQTEPYLFQKPEVLVGNNVLDGVLNFLKHSSYFRELNTSLKTVHTGKAFVQITDPKICGLLGGELDPLEVCITDSGLCKINILFKPVVTHDLMLDNNLQLEKLNNLLSDVFSTSWLFCPGLKPENICETTASISTLEKLYYPFLRYQSRKCTARFQGKNCDEILNSTRTCLQCRTLLKYFTVVRKRKILKSLARNQKRKEIAKNYSVSRFSSRSRRKKSQKINHQHDIFHKPVLKLEQKWGDGSVILSENHSIQMKEIVSIINCKFSKELYDVINDASCNTEKNETLLRCWEEDSIQQPENDIKRHDRNDQLKCETSEKIVKWKVVTFRIALAVFLRFPAVYEALKCFKILQLPCVRSLKNTTDEISTNPGDDNHEYLLEQSLKYNRFCEEKRINGERVLSTEGMMVCDEVKLIEKVIWNLKSREFTGFAMSRGEHSFLNDIFDSCPNGELPPRYILQFLWRDVTSAFDVVGPFFPFNSSFEEHKYLACLNVALRSFENYGFHTVGIVCDGANENLALIKQSIDAKGPFWCSSFTSTV